jgi:acyl carrier protein
MESTEPTTMAIESGQGGSMEAQIRTIWMETLEIEAIQPTDSFFDLGGESITGTLCAHRLQQQFGVALPLSALLDEHTTVAALAARIRALLETQSR